MTPEIIEYFIMSRTDALKGYKEKGSAFLEAQIKRFMDQLEAATPENHDTVLLSFQANDLPSYDSNNVLLSGGKAPYWPVNTKEETDAIDQ